MPASALTATTKLTTIWCVYSRCSKSYQSATRWIRICSHKQYEAYSLLESSKSFGLKSPCNEQRCTLSSPLPSSLPIVPLRRNETEVNHNGNQSGKHMRSTLLAKPYSCTQISPFASSLIFKYPNSIRQQSTRSLWKFVPYRQLCISIDCKTASSNVAGRSGVGPIDPTNETGENCIINVSALREAISISDIPIYRVLQYFLEAHPNLVIWKNEFSHSIAKITQRENIKSIDESTINNLFKLLDRNGNDCVDSVELLWGVAQICQGTREDRIRALFELFSPDINGYLSFNSILAVFTTIYGLKLSPRIVRDLKQAGIYVSTVDELALLATEEILKQGISIASKKCLQRCSNSFTCASPEGVDLDCSYHSSLHVRNQTDESLLFSEDAKNSMYLTLEQFSHICELIPSVPDFTRYSPLRVPLILLLKGILASPIEEISFTVARCKEYDDKESSDQNKTLT